MILLLLMVIFVCGFLLGYWWGPRLSRWAFINLPHPWDLRSQPPEPYEKPEGGLAFKGGDPGGGGAV